MDKKKDGETGKNPIDKTGLAKLALDLVIAYYIVMFFLTFTFMGCTQTIAYPCFTKISEENQCYIGTKEEITPQTELVAGVSYFSDGTCGGSCDWQVSNTSLLTLPFNGGLTIERDGKKLSVNGAEIAPGGKWTTSSQYYNIDPWIIEEETIELENTGTVECVGSKDRSINLVEEEYDFLLVNGTRKLSVKPNPIGIISFFVFLALLAWLERKRLKDKGLKEHILKSTKFRLMAAMCIGISLFVAFTLL